jgi:glutathione S-transferase
VIIFIIVAAGAVGLLPVLEIDGRVVTESATIMALLEPFPNHR